MARLYWRTATGAARGGVAGQSSFSLAFSSALRCRQPRPRLRIALLMRCDVWGVKRPSGAPGGPRPSAPAAPAAAAPPCAASAGLRGPPHHVSWRRADVHATEAAWARVGARGAASQASELHNRDACPRPAPGAAHTAHDSGTCAHAQRRTVGVEAGAQPAEAREVHAHRALPVLLRERALSSRERKAITLCP